MGTSLISEGKGGNKGDFVVVLSPWVEGRRWLILRWEQLGVGVGSGCVVLDLLASEACNTSTATWNLGWTWGRGKESGRRLCTDDWGGGMIKRGQG